MDAREREGKVKDLRTEICQEFIRMFLLPGWQKSLFATSKDHVEKKSRYYTLYKPLYIKMCEIGEENFTVEDLDVTAISNIVGHFPGSLRIDKDTKKNLSFIQDDRNLLGHSTGKESDEEIYLRCLLGLITLRKFVISVVDIETEIDGTIRDSFLKKYLRIIKEQKELADDERIKTVELEKEIDKDIQTILEHGKHWLVWNSFAVKYSRPLFGEGDTKNEFFVRASDEGIYYAHKGAAHYFLYVKKDFKEFERRLFRRYEGAHKFYSGK